MNTPTEPDVILVNRCFIIRQGKILAVKRSATDKHNPQQWEAPGGKLDQGQDLTEALHREIEEETGLLIDTVDQIVHADSYVIEADSVRYPGKPYVVLFSIATITSGHLQLSDEHEDVRWCSYQEFLSLNLAKESRKAAEDLAERLRKNGVS